MTVKKIFGKLHLWLGLASGVVVFIVCITGAIWAFSPEIEDAVQSYRHVQASEQSFLPVSRLKEIAEKYVPGKKANSIDFLGKDKSASIYFYGEDYYNTVFLNPYDGAFLKLKDNKTDFFGIVISGHYSLWLGEAGGAIVKWATVIFLIMLISGIVLWWPKNKAARKQRFKMKLGTSHKRLNYDLHNVLGFYAAWVLVFAAITGIIWTFDWAADAEYWLASGGKEMPEYPNPVAKKQPGNTLVLNGIDSVFNARLQQYNNPYLASVRFPENDSAAFNISFYPYKRYYDNDDFYFNQYTFSEIPVAAFGKYADANGGEKLSRMNFDIHIGNIIGLPGRIAMFLAVLIGASLPVTGFYIWWGRNKKQSKKQLLRKSVTKKYSNAVKIAEIQY